MGWQEMNLATFLRDWRQYVRRPDRAFWADLLAPAPPPTPADAQRRARIARYALGAALAVTLLYVLVSLLVAADATRHVIVLNTVAALAYGCGMWAASLGADRAARMWLMTTFSMQLALLVALTGPVLGVTVYGFVVAALARVLFAPQERIARLLYVCLPLVIVLAGFALGTQSVVDFTTVPSWLLVFARVANSVLALAAIVLLLGVFEREVLRSEHGLVAEKERSEQLLHVILPRAIADTLQQEPGMIADHYPDVTVLFADIAGFTPWAASQPPEAVVHLLEQVFSRFDARVSVAGAEKIKTIGDAYMAICGAPEPCDGHAQVMAGLALGFMKDIADVARATGIPLALRVGLHSGPVIAGVIGTVRFSYDVWGDTVNTASRMESQGEVGRIQLSTATRTRLGDSFVLEQRGEIDIKGKGRMETWWLLGTTEGAVA